MAVFMAGCEDRDDIWFKAESELLKTSVFYQEIIAQLSANLGYLIIVTCRPTSRQLNKIESKIKC